MVDILQMLHEEYLMLGDRNISVPVGIDMLLEPDIIDDLMLRRKSFRTSEKQWAWN